MSWRSVVITKPAQLKLAKQQLEIRQEQTVAVPLEDIAVIVLESPQCTITGQLLSELAERGIVLLTCGADHHPNGALLSYLPHSRQTRMLRKQLALSEPQRKRAWALIVSSKLVNQAEILKLMNIDGADWLLSLSRQVRSGDSENCEAQGAAYYFPRLFGRAFTRDESNWINSALNYGYAIIRAAIARALVAHGFLPAFGLFHRSEQNAFNLADDFIEPFRPLIDLAVATAINNNSAEIENERLQPVDKTNLIQLLHVDMIFNNSSMTTLAAIESVCDSFVAVCESENFQRLQLPTIKGLELSHYE